MAQTLQGYECVYCSATFQSLASEALRNCCFCNNPTKTRPHLNEPWEGPGLPIRHDRESFVDVIAQFMHSIKRAHELELPEYQIPADASPVWMPFRRVRARAEGKLSRSASTEALVIRKDFVIDVFCGAGLEETLVQELQFFANELPHLPEASLSDFVLKAGEASDDDLGVRAASSLRRWLTANRSWESCQNLTARFLEAPEAGILYWMPVWLHSFELNGERCVLAMDAYDGQLVAHLPRAPQPVDYLKHLLPLGNHLSGAAGKSDTQSNGNYSSEPALSSPLSTKQGKGPEPMGLKPRTPEWLYWPYDRFSGLILIGLSCFTATRDNRLWMVGLAIAVILGGALSRAYVTQSRRFARSGLAEDWDVFRYFRNLNLMVQAGTMMLAVVVSAYWVQQGLLGESIAGRPKPVLMATQQSSAQATEWTASESVNASVVDESGASIKREKLVVSGPREIEVGVNGLADLARAVAISRAGDTIKISAEAHVQYSAPVIIDHDIKIVGAPGSQLIWHGGIGPFIQVLGQGLHVSIEHIHFTGYNIRGSIVGESAEQSKFNRLLLKDVWVDVTGGSALMLAGRESVVEILGGEYRSDKIPVVLSHAASLSVAAWNGQVTKMEVRQNERERVEHAMVLSDIKQLALKEVEFSGNHGANVGIVGDVELAEVLAITPTSGPMIAVLSQPRGNNELSEIPAPGRYRIHLGQIENLATPR